MGAQMPREQRQTARGGGGMTGTSLQDLHRGQSVPAPSPKVLSTPESAPLCLQITIFKT